MKLSCRLGTVAGVNVVSNGWKPVRAWSNRNAGQSTRAVAARADADAGATAAPNTSDHPSSASRIRERIASPLVGADPSTTGGADQRFGSCG